MLKLEEPTLNRSTSTGTELSSQTSDLSEAEAMDASLRVTLLPSNNAKPSSSITTGSSSIFMSGTDLKYLSNTLLDHQQHHPRGCLLVRTQHESLAQSIDDRLASNNQRPSESEQDATQAPTRVAVVTFDKLFIREHARRPGDNPGCRVGVSLTLEWEVQQELSLDLEAYEAARPPRRDRGELNIPADARMQLLKEAGWSRGELLSYIKLANVARGQRNRTNETLQLAAAQELAQRLVRGVLNKSVRRSQKKKEKQLIQEQREKDQKRLELRRQLTPEECKWSRRRRSSSCSLEAETENPAVEQAVVVVEKEEEEPQLEEAPTPATTSRKIKRDSLAMMAPINLPTKDDFSAEETPEEWRQPLATVPEIEC